MAYTSFFLGFILFLSSQTFAAQNIITYSECESNQLHVTLNKNNTSTKKDILNGIAAVTSYGDLKATPQYSGSAEIHYMISAAFCEVGMDGVESCPEPRSWNEIQWRLKSIKGARVRCLSQEAEAAPDKEHGGVTGQNGD